VFGVARIAGIQAAKRTSDWIPLCHPLPIESLEVHFEPIEELPAIEVEARVRVSGKTGVEMEALVCVSAAALAIYDMCKSIDRGMVIDEIRLVRKSGGESGRYERTEQGGSG
jgi:cyclic pyranopterin phosphate synthase